MTGVEPATTPFTRRRSEPSATRQRGALSMELRGLQQFEHALALVKGRRGMPMTLARPARTSSTHAEVVLNVVMARSGSRNAQLPVGQLGAVLQEFRGRCRD